MLRLSCSISKPQLCRGGRLSVHPMPAANCMLCLGSLVPVLVSAGAGLSPGRKSGPICQITSLLGDRPWQGEHPQGADPRHGPGAGWAGGLRDAGLVLEGSMRHRSAPAQGITAP